MSDAVTDAILSLNRQLDLPSVLNKMLEAAMATTGAPLAAINVVDDQGVSIDFHYQGIDASIWQMIKRAPNSVGTLAQIPADHETPGVSRSPQGAPAARVLPGLRVARPWIRVRVPVSRLEEGRLHGG